MVSREDRIRAAAVIQVKEELSKPKKEHRREILKRTDKETQ